MKKSTYIASLVSVSIILISVYVYYSTVTAQKYRTIPVTRGSLINEVSANGNVEASENVYLHFKNTGKVTDIPVKVGDAVKAGDILARQDSKEVNSQSLELLASINFEKARLNQLKAGSSQEEIDIATTNVSNATVVLSEANASLDNLKTRAVETLKNNFTIIEDIIRNKADQMIANPQSQSPKLIPSSGSTSGIGSEIELSRVALEKMLVTLNARNKTLDETSKLSSEILYHKEQLSTLKVFLDKLSVIVNSPSNRPVYLAQIDWDQWRNTVAQSKASVNTMYTDLTSLQSSLTNGEAAVKRYEGDLKIANDQLRLKKNPTRKTDLAVLEAQYEQSLRTKAKNDSLKQDFVLTAPFAGLITEVNAKEGELSGPSKNFITLLSLNDFQIKINVVENNIAKVKIGQIARVTFDAMKGKEYEATVTAIDPAETVINGTIYYKTTLLLKQAESFIKPGMTANVWIVTDSRDATLLIPAAALMSRSENMYSVMVLDNGSAVEKQVTLGLKDRKGNIEIVSGLNEGDQVIIETLHDEALF